MSGRNLTTSRRQVFGREPDRGTECRVCGRDVDDGRAYHCSDYCRSIVEAVMSMLNWSGVRRRILERDEHTCQRCGFNQRWLDDGYAHLREIVKSKLPEEPEAPSILELGKGNVSDKEREEYRREFRSWQELKRELKQEYFGTDRRHIGWISPPHRLEVDHIKPVSEGGHPFDPANLQTLCRDCHEDKTADEASNRAAKRAGDRPSVEAELMDYVADGGFMEVAEVGDSEGQS